MNKAFSPRLNSKLNRHQRRCEERGEKQRCDYNRKSLRQRLSRKEQERRYNQHIQYLKGW